MRGVILITTLLVAGACAKPSASKPDAGPAVSAASDAESLEVLRESARELLDTNCGECHTRGLPTALPRALAVYDLTQLEWSRRMTDAQLREAERRLREPVGPTREEAEVRPIRASDADLERFHRYVALETERRTAAPAAL